MVAFQFKFTKTQRTKKSAQSFATGLFDMNTARDVYYPEPLKYDPILRVILMNLNSTFT